MWGNTGVNWNENPPTAKPRRRFCLAAASCIFAALVPLAASGQTGKTTGKLRQPFKEPDLGEKFSQTLEISIPKIDAEEGEIKVIRGRSRVMHSRGEIYRSHVADPEIVDIVQFSSKEISIVGLERGATTVTLWMNGNEWPITVLVRVIRDPEMENIRERDYGILEARLNEMFPNSHIRLVPVANKVAVMGQARDAKEASQIIAIVTASGNSGNDDDNNGDDRDQGGGGGGNNYWRGGNGGNGGGGQIAGTAAPVFPGQEDGPASLVVNMLDIPGEQTVKLHVKICELNRSALRDIGVDFRAELGNIGQTVIETLLSGQGNINMSFDLEDITFTLRALASNGTLKILAEPSLVTLSGNWASFLAGSEFAVPTVVGLQGAQAVTTQFRGFGVNLDFMPTVLDKDRIRLIIAPEFSQVNTNLTVGGIPGLNTRTAFTTVDLRSGQSYAIAGLIQDTTENENNRIPYLGDIPFLGTLFSNRHSTHNERELMVIVTPELVAPMESDEVPPLPGYDVTEPNDTEFYWIGLTEGHAGSNHRSTIWPINWTRVRDYMKAERRAIAGPTGHTLPEYDGEFEEAIDAHPTPMTSTSQGSSSSVSEAFTVPSQRSMTRGPLLAPPGATHSSPREFRPPTSGRTPLINMDTTPARGSTMRASAPMQGNTYMQPVSPSRGNEPSTSSRFGWQQNLQSSQYR